MKKSDYKLSISKFVEPHFETSKVQSRLLLLYGALEESYLATTILPHVSLFTPPKFLLQTEDMDHLQWCLSTIV